MKGGGAGTNVADVECIDCTAIVISPSPFFLFFFFLHLLLLLLVLLLVLLVLLLVLLVLLFLVLLDPRFFRPLRPGRIVSGQPSIQPTVCPNSFIQTDLQPDPSPRRGDDGK